MHILDLRLNMISMRKLDNINCDIYFGSLKLKVTKGALVVTRESISGAFYKS